MINRLRIPLSWPATAFSMLSVVVLLVALQGCKDDEEENPFKLEAEKISEGQILLEWTPVAGAFEYKVWRTIGGIGDPELLSSNSTSLEFVDDKLPQNSITYYITATLNGKEVQSNIVGITGREFLRILPYQMELIPEKNLAVIREYGAIVFVDYEKRLILNKVEFSGRIGQFGMYAHDGRIEIFVPSTDHNIYVLDADEMYRTDTIATDNTAYAITVNSQGKMFCSGGYSEIRVYDLEGTSSSTSIPAEPDCSLVLQDDQHLISVSTHLSPATMSYYTFDDNGAFVSKKDDPYAWEYEIDPERVDASSHFIATTLEDFIYTADENMTFVIKGTLGGISQTDFEFSSDGKTIYSANSQNKWITATTGITTAGISGTTFATTGYPWIMRRTGKTMIILSAPTAFLPTMRTDEVIIEKVTLL